MQPARVVPVATSALKYAKKNIPKALREQVWLTTVGRHFDAKCATPWCKNTMTVFDFHAGHRVAEARGGDTTLANLVPICSRCNLSMGTMTFDAWSELGATVAAWDSTATAHPKKNSWAARFFCRGT
jgi:5-methylcytosine-specific restriction endonuclease McrA